MPTPVLISKEALVGMRVGISVSDSDDLPRLGLTKAHAEIAVGEVARSVLIAGGSLVYGGRIKPSGFTQYLMHEVRRYGRGPHALTLCLAAPEHRKLSLAELDAADRELGTKGRILCLDEEGCEVENILSSKPEDPDPLDDDLAPQAYSSMRTFMGTITDARVLIGGNLGDFAGRMPGVIEEAIVALEAGQLLLVSAGFGGAAALVAQQLQIDDLRWAPQDFPLRASDERIDLALAQLAEAATTKGWDPTSVGLDPAELQRLSASHRAGEIASLAVAALSRASS